MWYTTMRTSMKSYKRRRIEVVITGLTRNRGRYSVAPCPESFDFTGFFGYS